MVDTDNFVFATDEEVASGLDEETGEDYEGFEEDGDVEEEDEEEASEEEDEEEEGEEGEEEPPQKTGDRDADGKANAAFKQRQKRREAEERAAKLEQELAYIKGQQSVAQRTAQAPQPSTVPEPEELDYSDLEGGIDQRFQYHAALREQRRQQAEAAQWQALATASAAEAQEEHEDYLDMENRFLGRLQGPDGQRLNLLMRKQADPADWLYRNQKRYEARTSRKPPEVEALEREIAELKKQNEGKKKPSAKRTLGRARGASKRTPGSTGPKNQEDAFEDVFRKR